MLHFTFSIQVIINNIQLYIFASNKNLNTHESLWFLNTYYCYYLNYTYNIKLSTLAFELY